MRGKLLPASQWQGGFQGDVKVTNTSTSTVNGWTVRWTFANGQQISQIWSATLVQSGAAVSLNNTPCTLTSPGTQTTDDPACPNTPDRP